MRNSIEHGFTDIYKVKYIAFNVYKNDDTKEIILDILDSGKGFSIDFDYNDYITFGERSNSNGSGIGGYLLDRAVKIHDGRVEY